MATGAELGYYINAATIQMANAIFGNGVTFVSASCQDDSRPFDGFSATSRRPGTQSLESFEDDLFAQIRVHFPVSDPDTGERYSSTARRLLKSYEARVLMTRGVAA